MAGIPAFLEFLAIVHVTPEPAQRVAWAVIADGAEPGSFVGRDHELAAEMFGPDVNTVPPDARRTIACVKGADVGWSFFGGLFLLWRALTASRGDAAAGETRPALVIAPDLRLGRVPVRAALGAAESVPSIARLIVSRSADGFVIKRGAYYTSVETLPAAIAGRAARGRRYLAGMLDEGCFFRDPTTGVVNDAHNYGPVISRLASGGQVIMGSTPWLESSLLWKMHVQNWNAPVHALAIKMPTLLVRSDPRVVALVRAERERSPEDAQTEFDCRPPVAGGGNYFDAYAVSQCATDMPILLPRDPAFRTWAGFDPAFQRDACAGVIVRRRGDMFEVAEVFERRPQRGKPLVPSETVREFAEVAKRHGCTSVASDIHYRESVREHLRAAGLVFAPAPGGNAGKASVYGVARELIHSGVVRWSIGHRRLTDQTREVLARPVQGGLIQISSPRRSGVHGDLASALTLALYQARGRRITMVEALKVYDHQRACAVLLGGSRWTGVR